MNLKFILLLIGLSLGNVSPAQTYSSITTDAEIYQFLNWMTMTEKKHKEELKSKSKQVSYKIVKWDTANFIAKDPELLKYKNIHADNQFLYQTSKIDSILKEEDKEFIFQQFTKQKDSIWHTSFTNSILLTNRQDEINSYHYSVPLFSSDKKYVIIQKKYYCGDECAYGGIYIYQRSGNKWKYLTSVNTWMS